MKSHYPFKTIPRKKNLNKLCVCEHKWAADGNCCCFLLTLHHKICIVLLVCMFNATTLLWQLVNGNIRKEKFVIHSVRRRKIKWKYKPISILLTRMCARSAFIE